jgi:alpha-beta hydrolase superfamily lysophospholipase
MSEIFELAIEQLTSKNIPAVSIKSSNSTEDSPRVIVLHGLYSRKEEYLQELLLLAQIGFRATAIDLALHGERDRPGTAQQRLEADWVDGIKTIVYDTVSDISAILDLWRASENSVGLYAVSAGGLVAHAVAVSDKRIGAIAAIITSPDWLTADPRLNLPLLSPVRLLLANISPVSKPQSYPPKALLMLVGDEDDVVSPEGSKLLYERLKPVYEKLGIADRLALKVYPNTGHVYNVDMRQISIDWLKKHLFKNPSSFDGN